MTTTPTGIRIAARRRQPNPAARRAEKRQAFRRVCRRSPLPDPLTASFGALAVAGLAALLRGHIYEPGRPADRFHGVVRT